MPTRNSFFFFFNIESTRDVPEKNEKKSEYTVRFVVVLIRSLLQHMSPNGVEKKKKKMIKEEKKSIRTE